MLQQHSQSLVSKFSSVQEVKVFLSGLVGDAHCCFISTHSFDGIEQLKELMQEKVKRR